MLTQADLLQEVRALKRDALALKPAPNPPSYPKPPEFESLLEAVRSHILALRRLASDP